MKHVCLLWRTPLAAAVALCAVFLVDRNTGWLTRTRTASNSATHSQPDVTAVLLNWVRLANVAQIVSNLCGASLDGVIKEIVVWNNNFNRPLMDEDFNFTCSKLRIHNSPENLYFQARFIACADASTPYCFIQVFVFFTVGLTSCLTSGEDDDYFVKPEIIRSMRARIDTHDIFHLPPDEVLSGHVLSIDSPSTNITFGFSWLGYGALILRSNAESFLSLLKRIGASEEETKMADNYYSILSNSIPELWTGHPIPLFGGGAFTVGEEGVARNRKHIAAATSYLDRIVTNDFTDAGSVEWPYVSLPLSPPGPRIERSPCFKRSCVLESTILFLPDQFATGTYRTAADLFSREAQLSTALTEQFTSNYVNHPLFRAVDADPSTYFCSFQNAADGDTLIFDLLDSVQHLNWTGVEWLWILNSDMAPVLKASTFSFSSDKRTWVGSAKSVLCATDSSLDGPPSSIVECRVPIEGTSLGNARYFRLQLGRAFALPWRVYETWLHGKEPGLDGEL
ncbi:Rab geranylgeranyltransferase [Mycena venus]|uniref:Rab geranylgeranyltransferase n=1 Tax=Mycena venus TaxID=2733690 RepID=A0A8H7CZC2_9AGAR|nr:Rab geranylgeranyltransferase [Mycena venus]